MAINTDISDLAWLTHPADPGASLARGVQAGAQIAQAYQQGAGLAQRQMELEARLKQLPLEMTIQQQTADMNKLKIENVLKARNDDIEATSAFTGLASAVTDNLKSGKLDEAVLAFTDAGLNNNVLLADPRYKALGLQLDGMQKEADRVMYWKNSTDAKLKAAEGAQFRSLPADAKYQKMLENAQANLEDEMAQETPDPEVVQQLQGQIKFYSGRLQLASDALATRQGELKAREARTAAINARTQELSQRLNTLDRVAMASELKLVDDQPNSKMDYATKVKEKQAIHAKYEAKATAQSKPRETAIPAPPKSNGEDHAYIQKDGTTYWVPREELDSYLKSGYTLKPE